MGSNDTSRPPSANQTRPPPPPTEIIPDNLDLSIAINGLTALAISAAFLVLFMIFRKKVKWIYSPVVSPIKSHPILHETSRFSWLYHTFFLKDPSLLTLVGFDGFVLIMTLKMLFYTFFWLSLAVCLVLMPVYSYGTYETTQIYTKLSIVHLESNSSFLWVPLVFTWIISLFLYYVLIVFYSSYIHLKQAYSANPACLTSIYDVLEFYKITGSIENTYNLLNLQSQTVLIKGLDKSRFKTEENVSSFVDQCSIGIAKETVFIKDHPTLRRLIDTRNFILRSLEKSYMNMLRDILLAMKAREKGRPPKKPLPPSLASTTVEGLVSRANHRNYRLTPETKRELLRYTFSESFLPEYRPKRNPTVVARLSAVLGGGRDGTQAAPLDLISTYNATLEQLDLKIEQERAEIFRHSKQLKENNEAYQDFQSVVTEELQLPLGVEYNDTRLMMVQTSASPTDAQPPTFIPPATTTANPSTKMPPSAIGQVPIKKNHRLVFDSSIFFPMQMVSKDTWKDFRLSVPGSTRSAFVTFRESMTASIAQQVLIDSDLFSCVVSRAPRSNEIVWGNISLSLPLRHVRLWTGFIIVTLINLLWFIPVTFVNSLNQINKIAQFLPFLKEFLFKLPPSIQTVIEGSIAPLLLNILLVVVPIILEMVSTYQGFKSRSEIQISLLRKYMIFLYLQTFFVSFLSGSIFNAMVPFSQGNIHAVIQQIRQVLAPKSSFFFNLIVIKVANDLFQSLANPVGLVLHFLYKGIFTNRTPREKNEAHRPDRVNYGITYPLLLFVVPLVLTYAVISPLMLIVGTVYYGIAYLVYRYKFLYCIRTEFESGGVHWAHIVDYIILAIFTFQTMTAIQFSFQGAGFQASLILPLLFATILFSYLVHGTYDNRSDFIPLGRRPDLASLYEYPRYKSIITRLHQKDTLFVSEYEDYSALTLIAKLIARQKSFLADVVSTEHVLKPSASSEDVSMTNISARSKDGREDVTEEEPADEGRSITNKMLSSSSLQSSLKSATNVNGDDSNSSLQQSVDWYMSNPYRNPTLFKRLNSLYLPKHFFRLVQIIKDGFENDDYHCPDTDTSDSDDNMMILSSSPFAGPPPAHYTASIDIGPSEPKDDRYSADEGQSLGEPFPNKNGDHHDPLDRCSLHSEEAGISPPSIKIQVDQL